ncbi:MAG: response regulator [Candidatus Omnitrophica bacterium]|nr:response regulator [Candidatus Omnitrophota bacterium]
MRKMLIVDDESEICEFLKLFFEERNFDVNTAYSGEEALESAKKFKPDVILLDIHMPGMDGITVLKHIKEADSKVKVIMVTALETREKIEAAMRLGADNYITKPLSLEYLERDVQEKVEQLARSRDPGLDRMKL